METQTYLKLKNKPKDNFPEMIIVHHSAASENQTVKSIEDYHLSLGWEGVGYQYLITKLGEVWKGRPEHYHGSHCKEQSMNTKSIGICLIGDFDKKLPTEAQKNTLITLMNDIIKRYPIKDIVPHRHFLGNPPYKTCFGSLLKNTWAKDLISNKEKIKLQIIELLKQL